MAGAVCIPFTRDPKDLHLTKTFCRCLTRAKRDSAARAIRCDAVPAGGGCGHRWALLPAYEKPPFGFGYFAGVQDPAASAFGAAAGRRGVGLASYTPVACEPFEQRLGRHGSRPRCKGLASARGESYRSWHRCPVSERKGISGGVWPPGVSRLGSAASRRDRRTADTRRRRRRVTGERQTRGCRLCDRVSVSPISRIATAHKP